MCRFALTGTSSVGATVTDFSNVFPSEDALKDAVANVGPISVAVLATNNLFSYSNGKSQNKTLLRIWFLA